MPNLLFEIFSEEMPARMQPAAQRQLLDSLTSALKEARLNFAAAQSFSSPRHLGVYIEGLPERQPDQTIERKGPKCSAPDQAVEGFCRSAGIQRAQLEVRSVGKDECYFAVIEESGRPVTEAIKAILETILEQFHWPKSMRWGRHDISWVRPVQSMICLLDNEVIPVCFGHLIAGDITYGHRFLAPDAITLSHADAYEAQLREAKVLVNRDERQREIIRQMTDIEAKHNVNIKKDEALLNEVTGLVEWPAALLGTFDERFLSLPPEVLVSEMREHQKYFAVSDTHGNLLARFVAIANIPGKNDGQAIIHGNSKVLRARLSDGEFFWNTDRETPLSDWAEKLGGMVFHAKLGSMKDKVRRMRELAPLLAVFVPHANLTQCQRAAALAKADLTTGMVAEFPELQGIMGRYYALQQQEPEAIADAISGHYSPLGVADAVPQAPVSIVTALSDKLDSLIGLFAVGEAPTGSKDPYALRRAALGVIRIVLLNQLRMPLGVVFNKAASIFPKAIFEQSRDATVAELCRFFEDRLKVMLKSDGVRHDIISAVMADGTDDMVLVVRKAKALQAFLETPDGANLLAAYRRARNILQAEEKKDDDRYDGKPDKSLLEQPEEQALFEALMELRDPVKAALKDENFEEVMQRLAHLRAPLDAYFDAVMVNVDEAKLRQNRLRTLHLLRSDVEQIADFTRIEG